MREQHGLARRRGFALHEAAVVVGLAAVGAGALVPALSRARHETSLAVCLSNLQTLELGSMSHAADRQDLLPNFDWIGFNGSTWTSPSPYPDLRGPFTFLTDAHAAQAIDIIRRRGGRDDFPIRTGWIPHVLYSHLPLLDYLGDALPSTLAACPDHEVLLKWQFTDLYDAGAFLPFQPAPQPPSGHTWPYTSSYIANLASWDFNASQDVHAASGSVVSSRIYPAASNTWAIPGFAKFGGTTLGQVAFPANKVHYNDDAQRHSSSPGMYYGFDQALVTMSFFDGSVDRRRTGRANLGWLPVAPSRSTPFVLTHSVSGRPWLDPIPGGGTSAQFTSRYLTTRCGLLGIDYGAPAPPCGLP